MKDVAELAGVSRTTVSFVVNGKSHKNIPEKTQKRIKDAVRQLGYRPNTLAQGLRSDRTNTIGFISDVVATTPYAGQIIQGAQELAWQHNNLLLLVSTGTNREMKNVAVETLLDRRVDGIIYASMYHREVHPPESIREVPTVLLDCFDANGTLPSVVPDEVQGGYDATRHLLEKGHRRIGYITDELDTAAKFGRLQGYQNALAEFGVAYDAALMATAESEPQGGSQATHQLMQLAQPPTALFCYNDRMAMGAMNKLQSLNLSIPKDIAIVGFDNQELIAPHLNPPLTTLQLPHYEMGQWAVQHLLQMINKDILISKTPIRHKLNCPLVVRASA